MICPHCGAEQLPDSRFCNRCGARLEGMDGTRDRAPTLTGLADSRRKVTVTFPDISGYTAMSERLDPEDVKEIMKSVLSQASAIVKRHGGQVDKFIGDCVMSVFGAEAAREDDAFEAVSAVREFHDAVLRMNDARLEGLIGQPLAVHSGVNTGLAVLGELDLERGEEKLLGDTVNVASRLCSAAKRDEIVVGRETARETDRFFDYAELGVLELKGKSGGVVAFRLLGARKGKEEGLRGRRAAFSGRSAEMKRLLEGLELSKAGENRPCLVRGEAGCGKSRLVEEFCRAAEAEGMTIRRAACFEFTQGKPYSLWVSFFSELLSFGENEGAEARLAAIGKLCSGIEVEGRPATTFIAKLFSIESEAITDLDAGFIKAYTERCIVAVLGAVCAGGQTLVVLDDLHWADSSSLEVLPLALAALPCFSLCLFRPSEQVEASLGKLPSGHHPTRLELEPLGRRESEIMLASLLGSSVPEGVPEALSEFAAERMKGNPFYIEETVNDLIERGVLVGSEGGWSLSRELESADIPETVQGVIEARIDRLEPGHRRVLQAASVIGQNFLRSILERLMGGEELEGSIEALRSHDLIRELRLEPELEYMFKHALMQEVVYGSLLRKARRGLHEKVAGIMEELFPGRLEEFYETIAFHYRESEDAAKAVYYLMKAGKKSLDRYASAEANGFYRSAYELLVSSPLDGGSRATLVTLLNEWGLVQYYYGDFVTSASLHERHIADVEELGATEETGIFWSWYAYALADSLRLVEALAAGERALGIGREVGSAKVMCYASMSLAYAQGYSAGSSGGQSRAEEACAFSERFDDDGYARFKCLNILAWVLAEAGKRDKALAAFDREIEYGIRHGNSRAMALGYSGKGSLLSAESRFAEAERLFLLSLEYTKDDYYYMTINLWLCINTIKAGESLVPRASLIDNLIGLARGRDLFYCFAMEGVRVILDFEKGNFARALRSLEGIEETYRRAGSASALTTVLSIKGGIYAAMCRPGAKAGVKLSAPGLAWLLANLPFAFGRAKAAFLEVLDLAERGDRLVTMANACADLGILYASRKRRAPAEAYLGRALSAFEGAGDGPQAERVRQLFAGLGLARSPANAASRRGSRSKGA